jgi:hypothetical protein
MLPETEADDAIVRLVHVLRQNSGSLLIGWITPVPGCKLI